MGLQDVRIDLRDALEDLAAGDIPAAQARVRHALDSLEPDQLLTTGEAADLLGVRSVNTVKHWCRVGVINGVTRHRRMMIPLAEIERVRNSERVRAYTEAQSTHERIGRLAGDDDLSEVELALLGRDGDRPGPWDGDAGGVG